MPWSTTQKKGKIYRRIRSKDYSYVSLETFNGAYGRVLGNPDRVIVEDAEFVVSEPGRQRVLDTRQKNVHAYVKGLVHMTWFKGSQPADHFWEAALETIKGQPQLQKKIVLYDPYEYETFTTTAGDPIFTAAWAVLHTNGVVEAYVQPEGEME